MATNLPHQNAIVKMNLSMKNKKQAKFRHTERETPAPLLSPTKQSISKSTSMEIISPPQYLHPPSLSSIQHLFPPKSVYPEKTRNLESNQPIDPIHSQCTSPSTKSKTLKIKPSNFLPYKGLLLHQELSPQYHYPPGDPKTLNRTRKGRV